MNNTDILIMPQLTFTFLARVRVASPTQGFFVRNRRGGDYFLPKVVPLPGKYLRKMSLASKIHAAHQLL